MLKKLYEAKDPAYQSFNNRITNCQTKNPSIGVRMPLLRTIMRDLAHGIYGDVHAYFAAIENACLKGQKAGEAEVCRQEEHMLYGMLIGAADLTRDERKARMDAWIPNVLSWADRDSAVAQWKFLQKDRAYWYPYLLEKLHAREEFPLRVPLVSLLQHYMSAEYIDRLLLCFGKDYSEAYYVRMAQAWALSICYIHFPEKTLSFFQTDKLPAWTHNKAIQKCRGSLRVSREEKERLKQLKKR